MRLNDAITGGALVVFAIAEIAWARTFPSLHGQSYGPDLFPTIIGVGLILCGSILIVRGVRTRGTNQGSLQANATPDNHTAITNCGLVLLLLLLYILLSTTVGFIPMSVVIMTTMLYRLGSSLLVSLSIAIVATLVIQFIFAKILLVPLPPGLLKGLVW